MKISLHKTLFKVAPLAGLFIFFAISNGNNCITKSTASFNSSLKSSINGPSDTAVYGDPYSPSGYYDANKAQAETGAPMPTGYGCHGFTYDYGVYYIEDGSLDGLINEETSSRTRTSLKLKCPYILPWVTDGSNQREETRENIGGFFRRIYYSEYEEFTGYQDMWTDVNNLKDDGNGQLSFGSFSVKGIRIGSKTEEDLTSEFAATQWENITAVVSGRKAFQNLTISVKNGELYDFDTLTFTFNNIRYTSICKNQNTAAGWEIYMYPNEEPDTYSITIDPKDKCIVTGTKLKNLATVEHPIWYEAAKTASSKGSFANESTAYSILSDKLIGDYKTNTQEYSSFLTTATMNDEYYFSFDSNIVYTDYTQEKYSSKIFHPLNKDDFGVGVPTDAILIPHYDENAVDQYHRHTIDIVYLFPVSKRSEAEIYLTEQLSYLVKECNVFDDVNPADPFLDATSFPDENVIFNQYEIYTGTSIYKSVAFESKYLPINKDAFQSSSISAGGTINCEANTFYSFEDEKEDSVLKTHRHIFNATSYSGASWLNVIKASGPFADLFNTLFTSGSKDELEYLATAGEENKVNFISNDAMFVRVSNGNGSSTTKIAKTNYNVPSSGFAEFISRNSQEFDFSSPGTYKIEIINRADSQKIVKTLKIYGDSSFSIDLNTSNADNHIFNLKINRPSSSTFKSLTVYKATTATKSDSQLIIDSTDKLTPQEISSKGLTQISTDDKGVSFSLSKDAYTFLSSEPSLKNQFHFTYYIEVSFLNINRYYLIYWNYIPAEADTIVVTPDSSKTWYSNKGYETTYQLELSSTTGEDVDPSKEDYDVSYSTPNIVSVDKENKIIKFLEAGETTVTFTLKNSSHKSASVAFNVTDKEELKKKIIPNQMVFNLTTGEYAELNVHAQPLEYFEDQNFEYQITEGDGVISFDEANKQIHALANGAATLQVTYKGEHESEIDPIEIEVNVAFAFYKVNVTNNDGGVVSLDKESYQDGEEAIITITPNEGYEIETIELDGQKLETYELPLKITMNKDINLNVVFKEKDKPVPPGPEPTPGGGGSNTGLIVGVCCGVGAVAVGVGVFLIIRAKKVGSMKK